MKQRRFVLSDFISTRAITVLGIAAIIALILNTAVSLVALSAGAFPTFHPMTPVFYAAFTILGLVAGWIGWQIVQKVSSHPNRLLTILVPLLLLFSFIPDIAITVFPLIDNTTLTGAMGLMLMHFVVVWCGVPAYIIASKKNKYLVVTRGIS